jgi:hypothetical protein
MCLNLIHQVHKQQFSENLSTACISFGILQQAIIDLVIMSFHWFCQAVSKQANCLPLIAITSFDSSK